MVPLILCYLAQLVLSFNFVSADSDDTFVDIPVTSSRWMILQGTDIRFRTDVLVVDAYSHSACDPSLPSSSFQSSFNSASRPFKLFFFGSAIIFRAFPTTSTPLNVTVDDIPISLTPCGYNTSHALDAGPHIVTVHPWLLNSNSGRPAVFYGVSVKPMPGQDITGNALFPNASVTNAETALTAQSDTPTSTSSDASTTSSTTTNTARKTAGIIAGSVMGAVVVSFAAVFAFAFYRRRKHNLNRPRALVIYPGAGSDSDVNAKPTETKDAGDPNAPAFSLVDENARLRSALDQLRGHMRRGNWDLETASERPPEYDALSVV